MAQAPTRPIAQPAVPKLISALDGPKRIVLYTSGPNNTVSAVTVEQVINITHLAFGVQCEKANGLPMFFCWSVLRCYEVLDYNTGD